MYQSQERDCDGLRWSTGDGYQFVKIIIQYPALACIGIVPTASCSQPPVTLEALRYTSMLILQVLGQNRDSGYDMLMIINDWMLLFSLF